MSKYYSRELPDREPIVKVYNENGLVNKKWTKIAQEISSWATNTLHLKYADTNFYFADLDNLCEVISGSGWRCMPSHWTMGQEYEIQKKGHSLGNWIVYEIVADTNMWEKDRLEPNEAFIYNVNTPIDKKLVIAHVFGHVHMFENNFIQHSFKPYSPYGTFSFQKERYAELEEIVGTEEFENFQDIAEVIGTLFDLYPPTKNDMESGCGACRELKGNSESKFLEDLVLSSSDKRNQVLRARHKCQKTAFPSRYDYNVLEFIGEHSGKLKEWQKEVLSMTAVRQKYLYSGGLNKVVHEGFAAFVDLLYAMMNKLPFGDTVSFIKHRTDGLLNPREGLNPYAVGLDMFSFIAQKWGSDSFGIDYDFNRKGDRRDLSKSLMDIDFMKGWGKVLEVAETHSDFTFFQDFFTQEYFNERARHLFVYEENKSKWWWWHPTAEITSRQFEDVRTALLFRHYNLRLPRLAVAPGGSDYNNVGELYLYHDVSEVLNIGLKPRQVTLDPGMIAKVMPVLYKVWGKPVHVETIDEDNIKLLISYDGSSVSEKRL